MEIKFTTMSPWSDDVAIEINKGLLRVLNMPTIGAGFTSRQARLYGFIGNAMTCKQALELELEAVDCEKKVLIALSDWNLKSVATAAILAERFANSGAFSTATWKVFIEEDFLPQLMRDVEKFHKRGIFDIRSQANRILLGFAYKKSHLGLARQQEKRMKDVRDYISGRNWLWHPNPWDVHCDYVNETTKSYGFIVHNYPSLDVVYSNNPLNINNYFNDPNTAPVVMAVFDSPYTWGVEIKKKRGLVVDMKGLLSSLQRSEDGWVSFRNRIVGPKWSTRPENVYYDRIIELIVGNMK